MYCSPSIQFPIDKVILLCDVVRFPEDVDDESTTFHPEYSHQLFGDEYVSPYIAYHTLLFIY